MTWAQFKKKWHAYTGKETSAYQEHFNDLCRLLDQPTPAEADPTGTEFFCFQKRVVKDAELIMVKEDGSAYGDNEERGFADVWKKDCFAWEYKGKKKNLDEAYRQLLRYRESLLNPPLLVVCDFDRYIVRTNFNGAVQETHEFTNATIDTPANLAVLRALFTDPDRLKPQQTTADVTEQLAGKIADVARSLQSRESIELADAKTRSEINVAEKKNLRIARFLNRIIFCFFAEDVGLLPKGIFTEVATAGLDDPKFFAERLGELFQKMAKGGSFGAHKIRHFNGHLFDEATVFDLTLDEIKLLAEASEVDWQAIEPSIMGTLFERALDDSQRARLGAHYTSETDIKTLVEPVLMAPLRREWKETKRELMPVVAASVSDAGRIGEPPAAHRAAATAARTRLEKFHKKLSTLTVLDPACGSGNFLYVSLQLLLALEKEVLAFATQLGFNAGGRDEPPARPRSKTSGRPGGSPLPFTPQVGVHQLQAIEINPYAFELAQVAVQIGYLQWLRDNGFPLDRSPVLQTLTGFQNEDALLVPHYRNKAQSLKQARAKEHAAEDALKFYTERDWPQCDVIVSNPPFLGDKFMRGELGDAYVSELRRVFDNRIPGQSDLCCYWFEKARQQIENRKCRRAGLLATQGIRGGASREALKRIKATGDIFFAESDRPWVLDGANVHVSMVGFDSGTQTERILDGKAVTTINANLSTALDTTKVAELFANAGISFQGPVRVGDFDVSHEDALKLFAAVNPHGKPNSDVLRPTLNGTDNVKRSRERWVVDFGKMPMQEASLYEEPFSHVQTVVKPLRDQSRDTQRRKNWWLHGRTGDEIRAAVAGKDRFLAMAQTAKYMLFRWYPTVVSPEQTLIVFSRSDDYFFGVLHSRLHEVWALAQGTQLREKESGFRYTPTTCFETFPLPEPTPAQEAAIAAVAKELNELRERWLNPPEWTREEILEFPASVDGPWSRYVVGVAASVSDAGRIGQQPAAHRAAATTLARYPRLVPKDADCAAQLKKRTLTNLYNERPTWLALAHEKLDAAVAAAYGWPATLTDEQILERLLQLNLERADAEAKVATATKPKTSRAKRADELI